MPPGGPRQTPSCSKPTAAAYRSNFPINSPGESMITKTCMVRIWTAVLICGLLLSNIHPLIGPTGKARATWSPIEERDNDNNFRIAWSNKTAPNSTLRDGPRDAFLTDFQNDLDKDQLSEFVVGDGSGRFYVYENTMADDEYNEVYSNDTGGSVVHAIACGDLDRDGDLEIITGDDNNMVRIYQWDQVPGSDNFTLVNSTNVGSTIRALVVNDLDGDFFSELIVGSDGGLTIFSFNETFHFTEEYRYNTGGPLYSVAVGDFDGDLRSDLATGERNSSSIYIFNSFGPNSYRFSLPAPIRMAPGNATRTPLCLAAGDMNQDGRSELFSGDDKGELNVLWTTLELGNMTFAPLDTLGTSEIWDLDLGDADDDDRMDLYVAAGHNDAVFDYELTGADPTSAGSYSSKEVMSHFGSAQQPFPRVITVGDPDADLKGDIIVGTNGSANDTMLFVLERDVPDNDVGVVSVNFPASNDTIPTGIHKVNATVKNYGAGIQTFAVNCTILNSNFNLAYNSKVNDVIVPSGGTAYVEFDGPAWMVNDQDTYYVNVTCELPNDENVGNDHMNTTVHVMNVYDLAVTGITLDEVEPLGQGENVSVTGTVFNNGTVPAENAPVHLRINDSEGYHYNDTDQMVTMGAGETTNLLFTPAWAPPSEGIYTINISVMWPLDHNTTNNYTSAVVLVGNEIDISCEIDRLLSDFRLTDPSDGRDIYNRNREVVVNGTVSNLGNRKETFQAVLNVTDEQGQSVFDNSTEISLGKGETAYVEFPSWNTGMGNRTNYTLNMTVIEENENQGTDNNLSGRSVLVWDMFDLVTADIVLNRSQPILSNKPVTVNVTVNNNGNMNVSGYELNLTLVNASGHLWHTETRAIDTPLDRSGAASHLFYLTTPDSEGEYFLNVTSTHESDSNGSNDRAAGLLIVDDLHDIGTESPGFQGLNVKGFYPTGNHDMSVSVRNEGNRNESFNVSVRVGGPGGNNQTILTDDVESGPGGWSHMSLAGDDLWHRVSAGSPYLSYHSAQSSWWFGKDSSGFYVSGSNSILYRTLDLREAYHVSIGYWSNHSLEHDRDFCNLTVNDDSMRDPGNVSWTDIGSHTGNSNGWVFRSVNLSAYAGKVVQIGFRVVTDDTSSDFPGIFLDDVSVEITRSNFVHESSVKLDLESGALGQVTDSYNFANEGQYLVLFESLLSADEDDINDVAVLRIDIMDYHDMGVTDVAITSPRSDQVRYKYDFEGWNGRDWTVGGDNPDWEMNMPNSGPFGTTSGFVALCTNAAGNYIANSSGWARTPLLTNIPWGARADFWLWYKANGSGSDVMRFQISSDGGSTWETLREYSGVSAEWNKQEIHFGRHYGNVYLRFLLLTDETGEDDGFYIDDLSVVSKDPFHAGEDVAFNVTIHNFGNVEETNPDVKVSVTNEDNPGYSHTETITVQKTLLPGTAHTFAWHYFPPANVTDHEEDMKVLFSTDINDDDDVQNDGGIGIANVLNYTDIEVVDITSPNRHAIFRQGEKVKAEALIANHGTWDWPAIPVNISMSSEEVTFSETFVLSIERNSSGTIEHTFTIPFGQGVPYIINVSLPRDPVTDMDFSNNIGLRTVYGVNLQESPAIFGFVTSGITGGALMGAEITLGTGMGVIDDTETDGNGFYSLRQPGRMDPVTIVVSRDGYHSRSHTELIPPGQSRRFDFTLPVTNSAPTVNVLSNTSFALAGDIIRVDVLFGDDDGKRFPHLFNVTSNISGKLEPGEELTLESTFLSLDSSKLTPGRHRIFVNISDPYSNGSAHFDITIYRPAVFEEETGEPRIWLRGIYGGNGTVSLTGNTSHPANIPGTPPGFANLSRFASVNVTGQGRLLWAELSFAYGTRTFPPGSYDEDLVLFTYDPGMDAWTPLDSYFVDTENGSIRTNLTRIPEGAVFAPMIELDVRNPEITGTEPASGADGIGIDVEYVIEFSELIDNGTAADGINVTDSKEADVAFTVRMRDDTENRTTTLYISFCGSLSYTEFYTVILGAPLSDLAANPINTSEMNFTTMDEPVTTGVLRVYVSNESGGALNNFFVKVVGFKNRLAQGGNAYFEPPAGEYEIEVRGKEYRGILYEDWTGTVVILVGEISVVKAVMYPVKVIQPRTWGMLAGNVTYGENSSLSMVEIIVKRVSCEWIEINVSLESNATKEYPGHERVDNDTIRVLNVTMEYVMTIHTGEEGCFSAKLDKGTYNLSFVLHGYKTVSMDVNISGGGAITELNITMVEKPPYGSLRFIVVDIGDNPIIEEAVVTLTKEGTTTPIPVRYAGNGRYTVDVIGEDSYWLRVSMEGYEDTLSRIWITAGVDGYENDAGNITMWKDTDINPLPKENKLNDVLWIVLIILIIVFLLIGGFFFLTMSGKDKKGEEEVKPEEEEEEKEPESKTGYRCPDCGRDVEEDAILCDSCGAEFDIPEKVGGDAGKEGVPKITEVKLGEEVKTVRGEDEDEEHDKDAEDESRMEEVETEVIPTELSEEEEEELVMAEAEDEELELADIDLGGDSLEIDEISLDSFDDEISISSFDQMVSSLLSDTGDEAPIEDDELPKPEEEEPPAPDEFADLDAPEDDEDDIDLDMNLDDISMEDFEKSLDELSE